MGLAPSLLLVLLAVQHLASLGAPQPLSSLDAKHQEIVDYAVVQLQVSCRVQGIWEYYYGTLFSGEPGPCRRKPRMEKFSQQARNVGGKELKELQVMFNCNKWILSILLCAEYWTLPRLYD